MKKLLGILFALMFASNMSLAGEKDFERAEELEETLTDMVTKARIVKDSMENGTLPERTKCFMCDGMCPYASLCFEDNRSKWDIELK